LGCILLSLLLGLGPASAAEPAKEPVKITIASFQIGSSWYVYSVTLGRILGGVLPQGSTIDTPPLGGGAANTQSTAWAVQGMIAVGADPASVKANGRSALDYLEGLQAGDGHFRYSSDSDQTPVWVTGQVLVAAAGEDFPVTVAPRAPKPAATPVPVPAPETLPAVPIPGVTPQATPVPPIPSGGGGSGGGGSGGGSAHAGPLIPESAASPPPIGGAGAILPPASPAEEDSNGLVEATPASDIGANPDDPASPWIPIGIGVGVGLLALLVPLGLGRRFAW
jgi:hypothetical protein